MERFEAMPKGWSFAYARRVIELAKAEKSLEEAARVLERTPKSIQKMSLRLGVTFKSAAKTSPKRKSTTT